jgi:hypothetical protein
MGNIKIVSEINFEKINARLKNFMIILLKNFRKRFQTNLNMFLKIFCEIFLKTDGFFSKRKESKIEVCFDLSCWYKVFSNRLSVFSLNFESNWKNSTNNSNIPSSCILFTKPIKISSFFKKVTNFFVKFFSFLLFCILRLKI